MIFNKILPVSAIMHFNCDPIQFYFSWLEYILAGDVENLTKYIHYFFSFRKMSLISVS